MSLHRTAVAPAPTSPSGGAGAPVRGITAAVSRRDYDQRRCDRVGARLHPSATEECVECCQPIGSHEYVRGVLCGPTSDPRLLGFVHVELCSDRLDHKVGYYAEHIALGTRLVDLG